MVATRALVDRCGPGHVATPLSPSGAGEGDFELNFTTKIRKHPPPQATSTVCHLVDVDVVPVAGDSRPDRLLGVSGPQERVQRHTVEQILDAVSPTLDVPVPLMGEQLVDVLRFFDTLSPVAEQVIDVPSRTSLRDACVASRSWWNRWWKCQQPCTFLSRKLTFQFVAEVFKVLAQERIRQRHLLFSLQLFRMMTRMSLVKGFFALFPVLKKCEGHAERSLTGSGQFGCAGEPG